MPSQKPINFSQKDDPATKIITSFHLASQKPINLSQKHQSLGRRIRGWGTTW
jgi:hypothetical protein